MKISRLQQLFTFLAILAVSLSCSVRAVTIAVSPSSISNLYQGYITLMVTNDLTNGETVLIEKFVDYNTNGAVDADDMLVQAFRPGDGQANVFGGVTNMNSPGDLTPTNGAISTVISFYGTHPGKFIGNYVFRVSSPTGNFSPATTSFTVTNSNFGQAISGAVRNNGTNVPYGGVFVLGGPDQNFIGGTFADSAGNYTYQAAPGTYVLGAMKSGYVFDFSTGPQVTLSSGVNATADAPLTAATRTISGVVRELGNPTKTLGGVEINCEAQNGFVLAFSDINGNFTIPVTADVWKLKMQEDLVGLMGYLAPDDEPARPLVDTTSESVSDVNIDLPKVNALFYGNLKTSANTPLVGIGVGASGSSDGSSYPYSSKGNTDANGNYFIGVVATNWNVGPESDTLSALGYSTSGTNTSINAGQAIQINFTAQTLTVHLGGRVVNGGGSPISNIGLSVSDWMGNNFGGSTDDNGNFNVGILAGTWHLQLAGDDAADRGLVGPDLVFSNLVDGANITNILYVAQNVTADITGNVHDTNSNPITFVNVSANITVNGTNYMSGAQTDGSGNYSLGVFNGNWSVSVSGGDLSDRGYETPDNQNVTISGGNGTVNFTIYPIPPLTVHLGGRVVNGSGNPIGNIQMTVNDQMSGNFSGSTDNDGYFNIGMTAGTWNLQLAGDDAADRGLIGPSLAFSNLVDGANITNINYVAQNVTAQITGFVRETNSNPLAFVNVFANATVNGTNYNASGETDGGGNYSIGVFNGTWSMGVDGRDLNGFETPTNQNATISGSDVILNFTIYPIQPLEITTINLPTGVVFQNYHTNLQATGGQQPYSWSLVSGSLPPGVNFDSGLIDGIPTGSGTFNFAVQVNDQQGNTTNKNLSITINPALQITTVSLPNGTNDQSYSANLAASGGVPPYTWQIGGSLPTGLNLNTNTGTISGTPTGSGTNFFTVLVNDSNGGNTSQNLSIAIDFTGSNPAPYFLSFGKNGNGRFEMLIQGVVGCSYRFEGSTTLASNSWTALQTSSANPSDGKVYFQDNSPSFNYRFYRAILLP